VGHALRRQSVLRSQGLALAATLQVALLNTQRGEAAQLGTMQACPLRVDAAEARSRAGCLLRWSNVLHPERDELLPTRRKPHVVSGPNADWSNLTVTESPAILAGCSMRLCDRRTS
jgi:hypothetical protein